MSWIDGAVEYFAQSSELEGHKAFECFVESP